MCYTVFHTNHLLCIHKGNQLIQLSLLYSLVYQLCLSLSNFLASPQTEQVGLGAYLLGQPSQSLLPLGHMRLVHKGTRSGSIIVRALTILLAFQIIYQLSFVALAILVELNTGLTLLVVETVGQKGEEASMTWNQFYDNRQFLFLFAKQTNPKQSDRRSTVQGYFPLQYSLL